MHNLKIRTSLIQQDPFPHVWITFNDVCCQSGLCRAYCAGAACQYIGYSQTHRSNTHIPITSPDAWWRLITIQPWFSIRIHFSSHSFSVWANGHALYIVSEIKETIWLNRYFKSKSTNELEISDKVFPEYSPDREAWPYLAQCFREATALLCNREICTSICGSCCLVHSRIV